MTSINSGAGFEADQRVVGANLPRREMEIALARVAEAKADGASWNARHRQSVSPFADGRPVSTRRIKLEHEAEAAEALARVSERDPRTKDARRRARSAE